jgi:putative membrane protein
MSETNFSIPRRQAPIGVVILFAENIRKLIQIVAALVFATLYMEDFPISTGGLVGIGACIMAVFTFFQYMRFTFHVKGEELILEKGVFHRERLSIPFDRIQTVHLSQNIIQQIVQVTGLKIDTAGSGKEELKISALSYADAKALQLVLQKDQVVQEQSVGHQGEETPAAQDVKEERTILVKLSFAQLVLVGLTENHIRSGLIAIGVLWGYYFQLKDLMDGPLKDSTDFDPNEMESLITTASFGFIRVLFLVVLFLIASVLVSMVRTILKDFNLEASLGKMNLKVSSGLLKRNEYSIPLSKIQMMKWQGNFLRNIPGFESVIIKQSSSRESEKKQRVEIPACFPEQTLKLENELFKGLNENELFGYSPHSYFVFFLSMIYSVIALVPAVLLYLGTKHYGVLIGYVVFVLIISVWVRKYVDTISLKTNGEVIQYSSGWLFTQRTLLMLYKVQSVKMSQSIFQEKRGTAHLTLFTAGGPLRLRFLPEELAQQLYDYFLYKVETSDQSWM